MRAVAAFDIDAFDQTEPFSQRDGVSLAEGEVQKTFHGDIEGASTVRMLTARCNEGAAGSGYVALEELEAAINGRRGSVVLLHAGTMVNEDQWAVWRIVPGSGTGELAGIRGEGRIDIDSEGRHTFTLEYELG